MPCRVVLLLSGRGAAAGAAAHLQLTWHLVKKFSPAFDLLAWPGRTRPWPKRKLLKVCTKVVDFIAKSRVSGKLGELGELGSAESWAQLVQKVYPSG